MATLTYVKGLPTPAEELNELGLTKFEMFLNAYCPIFHRAACETVNFILSLATGQSFIAHKSSWNTHLQQNHGISKRHANGVISFAAGAVDSAKECRGHHIKTLERKLKSAQDWVKRNEKKLADSNKFYGFNSQRKTRKAKSWKDSQTGCSLPLSCSLQFRQTNWQNRRFQIHQKKRRIHQLTNQVEHLKTAPLRVRIPCNQCFVVGSKGETFGNQACQWNGQILTFRVPYCLEAQFGTHVSTKLGNFERNINRIPKNGARTWHFHRKNEKWNAAVQFTPAFEQVSKDIAYGSIGIDLNPGSIGWAYVDKDGNLRDHGQIPLEMGLPNGQQQAQIVRACLQLVAIATRYVCPIVLEDLDFSTKKEQLREKGKKYSRMLSGWSYSQFFKSLESIAGNRGIEVLKVNPAYTSLIGLVKYARQYGLASDEAAGIAIARRGMNLSEKMKDSITAYLCVKDGKHVWSLWSQLNNLIKRSRVKRHNFYSISNWESQVKQYASRKALEIDET